MFDIFREQYNPERIEQLIIDLKEVAENIASKQEEMNELTNAMQSGEVVNIRYSLDLYGLLADDYSEMSRITGDISKQIKLMKKDLEKRNKLLEKLQ